MSDLFDALVERLIGREGRYSNDPHDAGGETAFGITVKEARANGYAGRMIDMTRDQAKAIYRTKYWAKPGLYLIAPLAPAVAEELFDTGVNMGTGTAGIMFQRSLNALNRMGVDYADVRVDGAIGPATAKAFEAFLRRNGVAQGRLTMLKALNSLQGARYIELCEANADDETFLNGWLANRVGIAA